MTTTATRPAATSRTPGIRVRPMLHYALHSTRLTLKNFGFVMFSLVLPVTLYVLFATMFGSATSAEGATYAALTMVAMAAYGSLGAAMSGGAQLALERRSGWFRQLNLTTLPPRSFLLAKAAVIMVVVLPALILVYAAGVVVGGVRAPLTVWLASLGLMWLALAPLTVLGVAVGLWVKAETVQGLTTLLLLVLAMLGGLWFPVEMMPRVMQQLAHTLPSYWLAQLGSHPFLPGSAFPWTGVWVLLAWTVGPTVLGALGYRRAAADSKR